MVLKNTGLFCVYSRPVEINVSLWDPVYFTLYVHCVAVTYK